MQHTSFDFSRFVACRYLGTKRAEAFITLISWFSVLGVAVGVMVLCVVMAIMSGFQEELREKVLGMNAHVTVSSPFGEINGWSETLKKLEKVKEVESVSPFTYHQVLLRNGDNSQGLLLRGLVANTAASEILKQYLDRSESIDEIYNTPALTNKLTGDSSDLPGIIIGRRLANSARLRVGSPVTLLAPSISSSPFGLVPRYRRFLVVGIFSSGLSEYESGLAYTSMSAAQQFFRMDNSINGFELRVRNLDSSSKVAQQITMDFPGLIAEDWIERNRPLWDALQMEKTVYFIVLLLIIVMASISIITTLVMLVLEKRKDIAVFMTMGASPKQVGRIFRFQGAAIGASGTILGLILGISVSFGLRAYGFPLDDKVFPFSTLPVRINPLNFALVGICSFVICYLATIYPAYRASHLDPSEVLRHD